MAKSTPNNNVFTFIKIFETSLDELKATNSVTQVKLVSRVQSDGKRATKTETTTKDYTAKEIAEITKEAELFLTNFKDYLLAGEYTKSEGNLQIVKYRLEGYTHSEIIDVLDLKESAYRVRVNRLTKEIYRAVFNRDTVPYDLVYLDSAEVIHKANLSLRSAVMDSDVTNYFSINTLRDINSQTKDVHADGRLGSREDYNNTMRFLAMYSTKTYNQIRGSINNAVLAYIILELNSKKPNTASYIFNSLMQNPEAIYKESVVDFNHQVESLRKSYDNRGDYEGIKHTTTEFRNDLSDAEIQNLKDARIAELEEQLLEATAQIESMKTELSRSTSKVRQLEDKLQENAVSESGVVNMPYNLVTTAQMTDIIARYLETYEKYESGHDSSENIFINHQYDGEHSSTGDTRDEVKQFLGRLTADGFKEYIKGLNPYDLRCELNENYKWSEND
jgi:hypothetical protein